MIERIKFTIEGPLPTKTLPNKKMGHSPIDIADKRAALTVDLSKQ